MAEDSFADTIATGSTIDDYLVSLASGLAEAQRRLNQLGSAADGAPSPVAYHIPKLEFELRMTIAMQQTNAPAPAGPLTSGVAMARIASRQLRFQSASSSSQSSIASTLRGAIVAVPTSGGRPSPRLDVVAVELAEAEGIPEGAKAALVTAEVSNAAGEHLEGEEVQFNVDRELSATLNEERGLEARPPDAGTYLMNAAVLSDDRGIAGTTLVVSGAEPAGAAIAITVDAVQRTRTLIYRVAEA